MGDAYICRRGGGSGGGLNFRVIDGTTAPASPKENDIWLNTATKITGWAFSIDEPFTRTENVDCVIAKEATRLDSTGTEGYFPQANLTDYIKLPDGTTKITTNNCDTVTSTMAHAFYTADKTLISTVLRKEGTTTFEVPSNAVYVRLSMFDNAPVNSDPLSFVATIGVESGFVWITTGTSSQGAFNALKDNGVMVYPISAVQYINGAWIAKETKSYIGGEWKEWVFYIFHNGEFTSGSYGSKLGTNCKVEFRDGELYIYGEAMTTTIFYTSAKFDCSGFSKLVFVVSKIVGNVGAEGNLTFGIGSTQGDTNFVASATHKADRVSTDTEYAVDISAVSGEYYVKIADVRSTYQSDQIYIKEIRLA